MTWRALSWAEREAFEFRVQVTPGSNKYEVDLTEIITKVGIAAVSKMTPKHILIAILGLGLIWGGRDLSVQWLRQEGELRAKQLEGAEKDRLVSAIDRAGDRDLQHEKLWAQALHDASELRSAQKAVQPTRVKFISALTQESHGGSINNARVTPGLAREIMTQERQVSSHANRTGVFQVAKVDTTAPDGFRVTLRDPKTGQEYHAALQDALVSDGHRSVIRHAEWAKDLIYVELTGRSLRGNFINPVILDVRAARVEEVAATRKAVGLQPRA